MKKASGFEIVAARCWNLLNEGKPFTPIFTVAVFALYHLGSWGDAGFWTRLGLGLLAALPLFALYFAYDFPLFLRNYLWLPLVAALVLWRDAPLHLGLYALGIGLFLFFTVYFWGTFYYHLRIGTSWWNFKRFWKLVLKNSDSTSGNAQEQLPKVLLLLFVIDTAGAKWADKAAGGQDFGWWTYACFLACTAIYAWVLHRNLFDWKPKEIPGRTEPVERPQRQAGGKVFVLVIDGMRKDRFEEANAPLLKKWRAEGTEYTQMETVYPARTVVCFSSMFTGAYPREHGITSNMVWKLGIKVESIFDSLRKVGKRGRLLGIAHLIDSMGDDVESVTAVMHNDKADRNIMERAKLIMAEQDPDLLVVQFIATDQTGHSMGALYPEYRQKIEEADALIAEFAEWLAARGDADGATFIVCADHGQADGIGGHGHLDEGERYVPFFLYGPNVRRGVKVDAKQSLISVAPTLSYLLGAPLPSHSRGPILTDAFETADAKKRGTA
ncbi:alkaline phosphatase family protein [Paenibacillus sp. MWE-103]|uniref:Alkaline phosphatase family protein n=1 Tax=Paenibacillus artemisiicola TaxID=1172618 RepID=A0ABS3WK69_9BACL|nr:alkaline phosphatase family protein [Paenibacillus artemisiicola]MBO7748680.1 alkaline phosphatase family protein [Paenibacillus artemisiicola]